MRHQSTTTEAAPSIGVSRATIESPRAKWIAFNPETYRSECAAAGSVDAKHRIWPDLRHVRPALAKPMVAEWRYAAGTLDRVPEDWGEKVRGYDIEAELIAACRGRGGNLRAAMAYAAVRVLVQRDGGYVLGDTTPTWWAISIVKLLADRLDRAAAGTAAEVIDNAKASKARRHDHTKRERKAEAKTEATIRRLEAIVDKDKEERTRGERMALERVYRGVEVAIEHGWIRRDAEGHWLPGPRLLGAHVVRVKQAGVETRRIKRVVGYWVRPPATSVPTPCTNVAAPSPSTPATFVQPPEMHADHAREQAPEFVAPAGFSAPATSDPATSDPERIPSGISVGHDRTSLIQRVASLRSPRWARDLANPSVPSEQEVIDAADASWSVVRAGPEITVTLEGDPPRDLLHGLPFDPAVTPVPGGTEIRLTLPPWMLGPVVARRLAYLLGRGSQPDPMPCTTARNAQGLGAP